MGARSSGKKLSNKLIQQARIDYSAVENTAERLLRCLRDQLPPVLDTNDITLGVPIESRVKDFTSVEEKLLRKPSAKRLSDIDDLVGIRLILLFRKDLDRMDQIIKETFRVLSFENTADRLDETQFGYQSNHYLIKLPDVWLNLPSYSGLGDITAEIQVRTLAQHIWAAASHKFQYKREESVPPPLRRTIHRVSALLETVDLEFGRVLDEREIYVSNSNNTNSDTTLNVDLLAKILRETWPEENLGDGEDYDSLLSNLSDLGVNTAKRLQDLLHKHKNATISHDREYAANLSPDDYDDDNIDRFERGVYFTHVGLTRDALAREFSQKRLWSIMGIDTSIEI